MVAKFDHRFCFAGFGTDRLRRQETMKTARRENPNHGVAWPCNRAHGAARQNRSRSIKWAAKQEKFRPKEMCFFLTSTFIELPGTLSTNTVHPEVVRIDSSPRWPCCAQAGTQIFNNSNGLQISSNSHKIKYVT